MARGDKVTVRFQAGDKVIDDTFEVTSAGGTVTVEWPKSARDPQVVSIKILGRTGKVRRGISVAADRILSLEEVRRDDE